MHFGKLKVDIEQRQGVFLRDDGGHLHVLLGTCRIPLNEDKNNLELAKLMLQVCDVSTTSPGARAAIQRLQVLAAEKASTIQFRRFSTLSKDRARLYVPVHGSQLLQVTTSGVTAVANGNNQDGLWVEHPCSDLFKYKSGDPGPGLQDFERLLVHTQSCHPVEMQRFIAMAEGLFPFIRDSCPARPIVVHIGPSQTGGKTSGAQRFTLLHGLGEVKGDFSVASFGNLGDIGLLAMDNKEHCNMTRELIDYLLFLSTGAQRGRSSADGVLRTSSTRPVGVVTTIEGAHKSELQNRCINVNFQVAGPVIGRAEIEHEILEKRDEILSSLIAVLIRYMNIRLERRPIPVPLANFPEYFQAIADLLRAFGDVAGRPAEWAENIISKWYEVISNREPEEDELEGPIRRIVSRSDAVEEIEYKGQKGQLYVTECESLRMDLVNLRIPDLPIPNTGAALSRRLRSSRFVSIRFLNWESNSDIPQLRRRGDRKPAGFFIPHDEVTENDAANSGDRHADTQAGSGTYLC